ncbi:hypothetical protein AR457_40340 [Streptomyces agglomeratus]|uniref:hypothetical protein n=1 Tax=Streptomyces agglomeratus TaxID=285458 RepID=UPI000852827D|nr:hypothetical protein [Streptomyces agglomeratus]OEJ22132.1 hypothetical protein AR457_40340 [Streptomyces agglomeratus]OEJ36970.1 hypothetical protein BGK70_00995 [Streptomyces agglomeratus]
MTIPDPVTDPDLPAGFCWADDLTAWGKRLDDGRIALLRPDDPQRAARWANVAAFYGAQPPLAPAPGSAGEHLVVGVGATGPLARVAARVLGRRFVPVDDLSGAGTVPVPDGGSVLLTAPAGACSLAALDPLLHSWSERSVRVGLLTGLDLPGISFSLAKILAGRTPQSEEHDVLLDGLTGTARIGRALDERTALETAVGGRWRTAVVEAHGSGSHALLGPYSVCGLTGERELAGPSKPVPGGCTPGRCRAGGRLTPLPLRDLACRTLALFVCTALILDPREHYPSSVSLAHAALEGHPAAVIGMVHQDLPVNAEPRLTGRLLAAGRPAGAVTADLNDTAGRVSGYLMLGDPEQTFAPAPAPDTAPVLTPWPHWRPALLALPGPGGLPGLLTRDGIWHEPADPVAVADGHGAALGLRTELTGWLASLGAGALFEDNLRAWAMAADRPKTRVVEGLKVMRRYREAAQASALAALHLVQKSLRAGHGPLPCLPAELDRHATNWAQALAEMSEHSRFGMLDQFTDAATATHTPAHGPTGAGPCGYCRGPLERTVWCGPLPGAVERVRVACPRCGLVADRPTTPAHTAVRLQTPTALVPGQAVRITVDLPDAASGLWLTVQLRDRGRHALATHHIPGAAGTAGVEMTVPADLQPEVHRIWALIVDRFLPAWHQVRVPSTPGTHPEEQLP